MSESPTGGAPPQPVSGGQGAIVPLITTDDPAVLGQTLPQGEQAVPAPPVAERGGLSSVPRRETVHRDILRGHEAALQAARLNLVEVEDALLDAGRVESLDLLKRKRELVDEIEWLSGQTARLGMLARQEEQTAKKLAANTAWEPLCKLRLPDSTGFSGKVPRH